jgi:hypothetical protein
VFSWLIGAAGSATATIPVEWAADALADAAKRWFGRFRHSDDLSCLVRAASPASAGLSRAEFKAVRRLLEEPQTWVTLGRGTVEDLAGRIEGCLSARGGRQAVETRPVALAIARGLLEFAVADLEPKVFQQVLLARLQRLELGQANVLDEALLGLQADLIACLDVQGELGTRRFADLMESLRLVLDRLPHGPAQRGEVAVYLRTLIEWLDRDPWPNRQGLGGPVLTPAAIERKLRVTAQYRPAEAAVDETDQDADEVVKQCRRLVILGGPGSGKTWLSKRAARRCAEDALRALAEDASLDDAELPLYTTCSHLFAAGGGIRQAAVSSALDQLPDLGGARLAAALHAFFTERNAPVLLVIDSLDEAPSSDERLRQASSLPWRIMLTSRPGSWDGQLDIRSDDRSHQVGELQPLRYPEDVEAFIRNWFTDRPRAGSELTSQIAHRPGLQHAATVPLMLAFYCIIGGDRPLPEFRHDLYPKVLTRMLTGRWRGLSGHGPDVTACLSTLRSWAVAGAASDSLSGLGAWVDEIPVAPANLSDIDQAAVDHIAAPVSFPDFDTGKTLRRFIHRSIREYLVASHIATLSVDEAAETLLPHLWHDPDWEYTAPAALAMHQQRSLVLARLICRAARSDGLPADLAVIDGGWAFRWFLARVAAESQLGDWTTELGEIIGRARAGLALAPSIQELPPAPSWETYNRLARESLLGRLAQASGWGEAVALARALVPLDPSAQDRWQACEVLLRRMAYLADDSIRRSPGRPPGPVAQRPTTTRPRETRDEGAIRSLADVFIALHPPVPLREEAYRTLTMFARRPRAAGLMGVQAGTPSIDELIAALHPAAGPGARPRPQPRPQPHPPSRQEVSRQGLVKRLEGGTMSRRFLLDVETGQLLGPQEPTEAQRGACRDLIFLAAREPDMSNAMILVHAAADLGPTHEDVRTFRDELFRPHEPPSGEDSRQAANAIFRLLAHEFLPSAVATVLVRAVGVPNLPEQDKREARDTLLWLLDGGADAVDADAVKADALIGAVAALDPTWQDKQTARDAVLRLLARHADAAKAEAEADEVARIRPRFGEQLPEGAYHRPVAFWPYGFIEARDRVADLALAAAALVPSAESKRQVREAVLHLLAQVNSAKWAIQLVRALAELDPPAEDKQQARDTLIRMIPGQTYHHMWTGGPPGTAQDLAVEVVALDPTAEDKRKTRQALLDLMARDSNYPADILLAGLRAIGPSADGERPSRAALLTRLHASTSGHAEDVAIALATLNPSAEERQQARNTLLGHLAQETSAYGASSLMRGLAALDPSAEDKRKAGDALVRLLRDPPNRGGSSATLFVLATVRECSTIDKWLAILPAVANHSIPEVVRQPSQSAPQSGPARRPGEGGWPTGSEFR